MTLKVGRTYKTASGVEVEILKADVNCFSSPNLKVLGYVKSNGGVVYFSADGTVPGSPKWNLQLPKKVGYLRVYDDSMANGTYKVVPFEYTDDSEE